MNSSPNENIKDFHASWATKGGSTKTDQGNGKNKSNAGFETQSLP